jgi:inner membrane protein
MEKSNFNIITKINNWINESVMVKVVSIGFLILLLMISVSMVQDLIEEREDRKMQSIGEVNDKWGNKQTVNGVYLTIPYEIHHKQFGPDGNLTSNITKKRRSEHLLPEQLQIRGKVNPKIHNRGIHDVIVYNTQLNIQGFFVKPKFEYDEDEISTLVVLWDQAYLSLGISDLSGVKDQVALNWNGQPFQFTPAEEVNKLMRSCITAKAPISDVDSSQLNYTFDLQLNLNGSTKLSFVPLGRETTVELTSPWANPSFDGAFLPDQSEVNDDGFQASWKVLELNRPLPQRFSGKLPDLSPALFGVNLMLPADEYQKSTRAAKYALLLIVLTFLAFFFIQMMNRIRIHPIQYLFVGFALCVFYALLISISEHWSFEAAYIVAAVATVALISLYIKAIVKRLKISLVVMSVLSLIYVFVFAIINAEDYSLIIGSVGLYGVLASVMYLSGNLGWAKKGGQAKELYDIYSQGSK